MPHPIDRRSTGICSFTYQKPPILMMTLILADIPPDRPTEHWDLQLTYQKTSILTINLILADIPPDGPTEHWGLQLHVSETTNSYDDADRPTC